MGQVGKVATAVGAALAMVGAAGQAGAATWLTAYSDAAGFPTLANWALMIVGVGCVGATLRRRRRMA